MLISDVIRSLTCQRDEHGEIDVVVCGPDGDETITGIWHNDDDGNLPGVVMITFEGQAG